MNVRLLIYFSSKPSPQTRRKTEQTREKCIVFNTLREKEEREEKRKKEKRKIEIILINKQAYLVKHLK